MNNGNGRTTFQDAITDDESLALFLRKMKEFEQIFCDMMFKGTDFTIRLEVRGNQAEILHVRCYSDNLEQVDKSQSRIIEKNRKKSEIQL